jgi:hypothetical protein
MAAEPARQAAPGARTGDPLPRRRRGRAGCRLEAAVTGQGDITQLPLQDVAIPAEGLRVARC